MARSDRSNISSNSYRDETQTELDFLDTAAANTVRNGKCVIYSDAGNVKGTTINDITMSANTGTAAGGGIDAVSPTIKVSNINGITVTRIFIDIGAGSIVSSSDANDVIGEDDVAAAYLTRITTAVNGIVFRGSMTCLELPNGGDTDIDLGAHSASLAEDAGSLDHASIVNSGGWTLAENSKIGIPSGGIQDDYLYLTHAGTTAGTYDAGKFMIELEGYIE